MKLKVHSIESFGTVDGPGVRYVIFTQGCPLRCQYCHNPDTWDTKDGKDTLIKDLLVQIEDLSVFLKNGGVTITGGEPLLHAKELIPLFKELKKLNIHTCIDTSGYTKITEDIKELLSYTDLILLDIKVMDEAKHIELTGVKNKLIHEFARYIDQNNIPFWIRHVLLPTINDSQLDLSQLKTFSKSFTNLIKVEVLPYHELGVYKWEELKLQYKLSHITPPTKERVEEVKAYIRDL